LNGIETTEAFIHLKRAVWIHTNHYGFIAPCIEQKKVLDCGIVGEEWRFKSDLTLSTEHSFVAKHASYTVGVDLNKEGLVAMKRGHSEFELVAADVTCLPFRDGAFDVVVALDLLEHLPNDGLFLKNVHSVLVDFGLMLGTTPNSWDIFGIAKLLFLRRQPNPTYNAAHLHLFDDWSLSLLMLTQNFKMQTFVDVYSVSSNLSRRLAKLVHFALPKTSFTLGFIAQKISFEEAEDLMGLFFEDLKKRKHVV
jgi:SAM-dependent methyltransferase